MQKKTGKLVFFMEADIMREMSVNRYQASGDRHQMAFSRRLDSGYLIMEEQRMFDFLKMTREPPALPEGTIRRHYRISGRVQGVGFRYRAMYAAQSLNLSGWVENMDDGTVEMELQGQPEQMDKIFSVIQRSDYVLISNVVCKTIPADPWERSFSIRGY